MTIPSVVPGSIGSRLCGMVRSALVLVALAACGGVEPTATPTWTISAEPTVSIGQVSGEEAYLFEAIRSARFLGDAWIVVADAGVPAVRIYTTDGEHLRTLGAVGEGPGEYRSAQGVWVTDDGVGIVDAEGLRLLHYGSDGELSGAYPIRGDGGLAGSPQVFFGTFGNGDLALASIAGGAPDGSELVPDVFTVARFTEEGAPLGLVGELEGMRRIEMRPIPFTPLTHTAIIGDSVYVADRFTPEVFVLGEAGTRVRSIPIPHDSSAVDTDSIMAAFRAELEAREAQRFLGLLEQTPPPDRFPAIGGLLADDRGRLWAKRYDALTDALWFGDALRPRPGGTWTVLETDGTVVASVRMPDDFFPLQVRGERVLGVSRDELDVERIAVHTIADDG